MDLLDAANNEAFDHARRVARVWWQVQVQVEGFFVQACGEVSTVQVDGEIKVADRWRSGREVPDQASCRVGKSTRLIDGGLEFGPANSVGCRRVRREGLPDSKAVVDEAAVFDELRLKSWNDFDFANGENHGSIHRSRGGAHCRAIGLYPVCVTKAKHVVGHEDGKGLEKGGLQVGLQVAAVRRRGKEVFECCKSRRGVDVRVHRTGVHGEEASVRT